MTGPNSLDQARVRATLRLLFDPPTADRLAQSAGRGQDHLIRAAIRRWTLAHWLGRLSRRAIDPATTPLLGPSSTVSATGAVGLAFLLGLGMNAQELSRATGRDVEHLGEDLYHARQSLSGGGLAACGEFSSSIGRYRDPVLDIGDRASLLHHAQRCNACRTALERFQTIDAALLERLEQERAAVSRVERLPERGVWFPSVPTVAVAAVIVVALAALGFYFVAGGDGRQTSPAPVAAPGNELTGWVLTQDTQGQVTATNLVTGQQQRVGPPEKDQANLQFGLGTAILSPDRRLIARQTPVGQTTHHAELTIFTVDGTATRTIEFPEHVNVHLNGWLDNHTLLEVEEPFQGLDQPFNDYVTGLQTDSIVVAVDTTTGKQRELFRGSVSAVYPSPDRTLVVVTTWSDATGLPTQIELRPLRDGPIGDVIARLTLQLNTRPVWAPDSSRFYVAIAPPNQATPEPATPGTGPGSQFLQTAAVSRTGGIAILPPLPGERRSAPVAVSPDGQFLFQVSISFDQSGGPPHYRLWRTTVDSTNAIVLTKSSGSMFQRGSWSPDGRIFMVENYNPFLVGRSVDSVSLPDAWTASIIAVHPDGHTEVVWSLFGDTFGSSFVGWLPEDAIAGSALAHSGGLPGRPHPVELQSPGPKLNRSDAASPDGVYVILRDSSTGAPLIWDRASGGRRQLPTSVSDLSWLPQSQLLIGAGEVQSGGATSFSRLMTFAPTFSGPTPYYDFRAYDPAGIGNDTNKRYAKPLFSPNEGVVSFFVVDNRSGDVDLWLAVDGAPPRSVYRFAVPPDSQVDTQPVAAWLSKDTLLFAEPGNWRDGLPRVARLQRLTLDANGKATIDTLTTLSTHGNEHGIRLTEIEISQPSGRIAYRLRHFTAASADSGYFDSVDVTTRAHIDSPLELSRQDSGSGMDWSPDGRVLAVPFASEIRFYSTTGDLLGQISGLDDPAWPVWVSASQLWFEATHDGSPTMMAVELR